MRKPLKASPLSLNPRSLTSRAESGVEALLFWKRATSGLCQLSSSRSTGWQKMRLLFQKIDDNEFRILILSGLGNEPVMRAFSMLPVHYDFWFSISCRSTKRTSAYWSMP